VIALLNATLRVSAILFAALVLVWLLHRRSASLRHAVLLIALACAAMAPALGALLPARVARVFVIPATSTAVPAFEISAAALRAPAVLRESSSVTTSQQLPGSLAAAPAVSTPSRVVSLGKKTTAASPMPSRDWRKLLTVILECTYFAGLAISLAMLAGGLLRLKRIAARSAPLHSEPWLRQAAAIAGAYGLRRTVHLASSVHQRVLATWGIARPRIVLPAGAEHWPEDRIRSVLLHELAHVRRHDWLIQVLANAFRAVYWFNPLVWITCAHLRQESEQACDDSAIEQGVSGTEYADHLLALARLMVSPRSIGLPAPAMAHRSTLMRRVAVVLDPATSRARATGPSVARVATGMLLVTWVVAACQVAQQPMRTIDIRPHQSGTGVRYVETAPPAVAPTPAVEADTHAVPSVQSTLQTKLPASTPPPAPERPTPQTVATGILELLQTALADDTSIPLTQFGYMMQTIQTVQRKSQLVIDDDGRDPAALPAKCIALLNALGNAVNSAAGLALRGNRPRLSTPRFEQLATDLRVKAMELSDAVLPVSVTPPAAGIPDQRLALSIRDLAATSLADESFTSQRLHNWLWVELNTLKRAAQSVADDVDDGNTSMRRYALLASIESAKSNAYEISDRGDETDDTRTSAASLATSLRDLETRLGRIRNPGQRSTRVTPSESGIAPPSADRGPKATQISFHVPGAVIGRARISGDNQYDLPVTWDSSRFGIFCGTGQCDEVRTNNWWFRGRVNVVYELNGDSTTHSCHFDLGERLPGIWVALVAPGDDSPADGATCLTPPQAVASNAGSEVSDEAAALRIALGYFRNNIDPQGPMHLGLGEARVKEDAARQQWIVSWLPADGSWRLAVVVNARTGQSYRADTGTD